MNVSEVLLNRSKTTFSGKSSACFILGKKGVLYPGVRIEISSFPLSISSVQAAVTSCLANQDQPVAYHWAGHAPELLSFWVEHFSLTPMNSESLHLPLFDPWISTSEPDVMLQTLLAFAVTPSSDFPVSAMLQVAPAAQSAIENNDSSEERDSGDGGRVHTHRNSSEQNVSRNVGNISRTGWIPGVNVEVGPWSMGLCAERVAIARALSSGYSPSRIMKIHAPKAEYSSPCGACRQVLFETMVESGVELFHGDGTRSRHLVFDLLPMGFLSQALEKESGTEK